MKATTNQSTRKQPSGKQAYGPEQDQVEVNQQHVWIAGGVVLVIVVGAAIWRARKKKKKQGAFSPASASKAAARSGGGRPSGSGSGSGRFQCTGSSYPLGYGTCHQDVAILQRYLKSFNLNLGTSGPGRDGVDGQFGPKTLTAAKKQLGKDTFDRSEVEGMKKALSYIGK